MSRKRAMKAVARVKHNRYQYQLEEALFANGMAQQEGPTRKKTWSLHDLKKVTALKPPQHEMIHDFLEGRDIVAAGSAGTGKTFVAMFLALQQLLDPDTEIERIIIVRSAVPTRDQGFMPGTLEEKAAVYEEPYRDIFQELLGRAKSYEDMKEAGLVEFQTTSFIRGVTWRNAVIVVDEGQSMTFHEINTIMTRRGKNSRVIFVGDYVQNDLRKKHEQSGFPDLLRVAEAVRNISVVTFTKYDIVRHEEVKNWIIACEELGIH